MENATLTPAQFAAFLVTQFCVPMIKGDVKETSPVEGRQLSPEERGQIGLTHNGTTFQYDLPQGAVLLDLAGPTAAIIFLEGDVEAGVLALDAAMRRTFPGLAQRQDGAHPRGGERRLRVYEGELDATKRVLIEAEYPNPGAEGRPEYRFVTRVTALIRQEGAAAPSTDAPNAIASVAQPSEPSKKKGWF